MSTASAFIKPNTVSQVVKTKYTVVLGMIYHMGLGILGEIENPGSMSIISQMLTYGRVGQSD